MSVIEANEEEDTEKAEELSNKADKLEKNLSLRYGPLFNQIAQQTAEKITSEFPESLEGIPKTEGRASLATGRNKTVTERQRITLLLAKRPPPMPVTHLVGGARWRQALEFGEWYIRLARAAGQRRNEACHGPLKGLGEFLEREIASAESKSWLSRAWHWRCTIGTYIKQQKGNDNVRESAFIFRLFGNQNPTGVCA